MTCSVAGQCGLPGLWILRVKITLTANFFQGLPSRETENIIDSKRLRTTEKVSRLNCN